MDAAVLPEFGDATTPECRSIDEPEVSPNSVIIDVAYCSLNNRDRVICRGEYDKISLPYVLGSDVAGQVIDVGSEVTRVEPGDRVVRYPVQSCGHCDFCEIGEQSMCREYGIIDGGCAEQVEANAESLVRLPDEVSLGTAACLPVAYLTAWRMIQSRGQLRGGEFILVLGGSGGVGTATVQLSNAHGATAIAVSSKDAFCKQLHKLGATHTINRKKEDIVSRARELTNQRGVDLVIDPVGEATIPRSIQAVNKGGRIIACGRTGGQYPEIDVRELFRKQIDLRGSTMGSFREFRQLIDFMASQEIQAEIHDTFPLSKINDGLIALREGDVLGNILVEP